MMSPAYPQAVVAFDLGESVGKDTRRAHYVDLD